MNGSSGFFINDSIYYYDLYQQHLTDDHLRMSHVGEMEMRTKSKTTYSSSLQLHHSSQITYSSHILSITNVALKLLQIRQ